MPGVCPVGLRAFLLAAQPACLRRLGQLNLGADPVEFLDHEPPARRRLQRDLEAVASEPAKELTDRVAVRRRDPPAGHLAGHGLDPLAGDLRTMLIQTHHDRHPPTPFASSQQALPTQPARRRPGPSRTHPFPCAAFGPPYSTRGRRGPTRARLPMPFDTEGPT